jgi:ABC-type antimicrobial peptide transport system permease subunit
MTVSGVVKDIESSTDFTFKEFISYSTINASSFKEGLAVEEWGSVNSGSQFFVKLKNGSAVPNVTKQIQELYKRNNPNDGFVTIFNLQPLSNIHFSDEYDNFNQRLAHLPTLYGLLGVAFILLLLGCINFINLTTAQAAQRAKEVGIRKTMGSSRKQLLFQFISETFLLTIAATIVSLALVPWLLKVFADFIPPALNITMLYKTNVVIFILLLIIAVSLLAGFYPSIILSKYKPALVLKNQSVAAGGQTRKAWLRKSLTVTQFVIAQSFIIAAMVVGKQIQYTLNKDLGFKRDGIITVHASFSFDGDANKMKEERNVLLQKLESIPGIEKICLGGAAPSANGWSASAVKYDNGKKVNETTAEVKYGNKKYFDLYKMKLLAGRYTRPSDSSVEYLINENYARLLGFKNPADAVGILLDRNNKKLPVVGVLKDFYFRSLHTEIKPLIYTANGFGESVFHIALKPSTDADAWKNTISKIEKAYKEVYTQEDFSYSFVDDVIARFYKSEQNVSRLLKWSTGLAIFISCLGLLGLVIYTTNLRYKEMGVRKVLGASVMQLFGLLSKDFMKLVVIAFVIAAPLAWWASDQWLQNFAYRTSISWWIFAATIVMMVLMALITLSFKTLKTAFENPVKSLRTE